MAARRYHALRDASARDAPARELSEAEEELLALLKARGVGGICASICKEIHYGWAVASGFRTLRDAGRFYFACGAAALGGDPARDFAAAHGLQLALFALRRFVHNEHVLVPALDCISVFCRLDVEGSVEFLAVEDAADIVLKCARFHDNKHDVISAACQALGALVLNDAVKDALSSPELVRELLGLVRRYGAVQAIARAALAPLGFLVTDAAAAAAFVAADGLALATAAMKTFLSDAELVWHVLGLLNALHAAVFDPRAVAAVHRGSGVARVVEAVATHLDTAEVAVEGFRLLARLAASAPRAVHAARALDLARLALFAYAGPQHRHTRRELRAALPSLHASALRDPAERARALDAGRSSVAALAALAAALALASCAAESDDAQAAAAARAVRRRLERALRGVRTAADLWGFLDGPLASALLAPDAARTDSAALVATGHVLLGGVQLRRVRERAAACPPPFGRAFNSSSSECFPPSASSAASASSADDRQLLPDDAAAARDRLGALRAAQWLDPRRDGALVVRLNLYAPAADVHCRAQLRFALSAAGGVRPGAARVWPLRLRAYRAPAESWAPVVAAQLALLGCLAWLAAAQVAKLARYRWLYAAARRHVLDAAVVALGAAAAAVRAQALAASSFSLRRRLALSLANSIPSASAAYVELGELERLARVERDLLACAAALVWWRLVRTACRRLRALEAAFDSAARGSALLEALGWLLALAVVCAAHAAVVMDGGGAGGGLDDDGRQRGLGDAVHVELLSPGRLRMASAAVQRWRRGDSMRGPLAFKDGSKAEPAATPTEMVRVVLELSSLFVLLSIVAAILRDRFDSSAAHSPPAEHSRRENELRLLDIAKQTLEAHGMRVQETSLAKRLRAAAAAGVEKIQSAVLAKADDSLELFDLRRAWGLPASGGGRSSSSSGSLEDASEGGQEPPVVAATKRNKLAPVPTTRLYMAEQRERELEQRLSEMSLRLKGVAEHLGQFQRVVREEMLAADTTETGGTPVDALDGPIDSLQVAETAVMEGEAPTAATTDRT